MVSERAAVIAMMRDLAELNARLESRRQWLNAAQEDFDRFAAEVAPMIGRLEESIKAAAEDFIGPGTKYTEVPGLGRIQFTDYKDAVRIADKDEFIAWAKSAERADLYEVEEVVKVNSLAAKQAAVEALKEGEVLPGVEVKPAHREATIRFFTEPASR